MHLRALLIEEEDVNRPMNGLRCRVPKPTRYARSALPRVLVSQNVSKCTHTATKRRLGCRCRVEGCGDEDGSGCLRAIYGSRSLGFGMSMDL